MATEQTPKKGRGRPAKTKDADIAAYKARIASLSDDLQECKKHKRSWEAKCDELWKKQDVSDALIEKLQKEVAHLNEKVEKLDDELEDKDIDYRRLVNITQSLAKALDSASDALSTIAGGI